MEDICDDFKAKNQPPEGALLPSERGAILKDPSTFLVSPSVLLFSLSLSFRALDVGIGIGILDGADRGERADRCARRAWCRSCVEASVSGGVRIGVVGFGRFEREGRGSDGDAGVWNV